MKKPALLFFIALATMLCAFKTADQFPTISCVNLKDKKVTLPADVSGKRTVIALMLSVKADKYMQKWAQPLYNSLMADGMGGMMGGNMYNANLCFVGAVKGIAKLALPEMIKKARTEVDGKYHSNFMYTDGDIETLTKALNITDKSVPHFIVIETDGKILFQTSGEYSDAKLNDITGSLLE
jgi:hypothetical protein